MTNNERIEAYFNNELPEADTQQLMQDINSDASLKSEFQFQESVIDGIKDYRKKELLARLDNIQVVSTGQSILLKSIGAVGIAAVVTIGTYMWVNRADDSLLVPEETNNTEQLVAQPKETQDEVVKEIKPNSIIAEEIVNNELIAEPVITESVSVKSDEDKLPAIPDITIPEVQEPESGTSVVVDEDLSAPDAMASSAIRLRSSTDVEVKLSKKYDFHYQVKNGRLILFGNFNKSPFEVIELKMNQGISSYLYFENHFYTLANDSEEIKPLIVIVNEQLIKQLEKRR